MITKNFLEDQRARLAVDPTYQNTVKKKNEKGMDSVLFNESYDDTFPVEFDKSVKPHCVKDQGISGRCWLFAGLNYLRYLFEKEYAPIDLSARYLYFYDLLEKSNYFLDLIIRYSCVELNDRTLQYFLEKPIQDSGQWTMFCNLVNKYGLVPESIMPENDFTKNTRPLINNLSDRLRLDAYRLRTLKREDRKIIEEQHKQMLSHIYYVLSLYLGEPPQKFCYDIVTGSSHSEIQYTPKEFQRRFFSINNSEFVNLINVSCQDVLNRSNYRLNNIGNIVESPEIEYFSVPMEDIRAYVLSQLSDGYPVWFGCDTKVCFDRDRGILDLDMYNFDNFLKFPKKADKYVLLNYSISKMNHAMVFTGVKLNNGIPEYWCVENSSGVHTGRNGYFVMKDDWFHQYVYQVVIRKEYLKNDLPSMMDRPFEQVEPWSPISTLARTE